MAVHRTLRLSDNHPSTFVKTWKKGDGVIRRYMTELRTGSEPRTPNNYPSGDTRG